MDGSNGAGLVNFTAGTKRVFFPTENRAFGADYFNNTVWKNTLSNIGYRGSMTLTASVMILTPHLQLTSQRIIGVGIKVTTAVAGARLKVILYNFVRQADTADYNSSFPIAFEIGEVSGATTGDKIITTDFYLPEGAYMIGVVSTHAVGVVANSSANVFNPLYWETLCGDTICSLEQSSVNIDAIPLSAAVLLDVPAGITVSHVCIWNAAGTSVKDVLALGTPETFSNAGVFELKTHSVTVG